MEISGGIKHYWARMIGDPTLEMSKEERIKFLADSFCLSEEKIVEKEEEVSQKSQKLFENILKMKKHFDSIGKKDDFPQDIVEENEMIKIDGFDHCIVGIAERCGESPLLVYDREKIVESLIVQGLTFEEAQEYVDFNISGAWMGEGTPLIMESIKNV
jgi:hypothetical protein